MAALLSLINGESWTSKQMRRLRITIEDLFEQLRQKIVFFAGWRICSRYGTNGKNHLRN